MSGLMTKKHKQLPIHERHRSLGARFGVFGEWEVPLYYSSVLDEHEAVRSAVGIFDISHMGEIFFEGKGARELINQLITNNANKLTDGKAIYSPMCNQSGGVVDDLIVYQLRDDKFLLIVNAGNVETDFSWFLEHNATDCNIVNKTREYGLLAIQGPMSLQVMSKILSEPIHQMKYYSILPACSRWDGAWIARTGYTGELGYELMVKSEDLDSAYQEIMEVGKQFGIKPVGFGARDTLRLEAAMLLCGQDMDQATTPLEAGLDRFVDLGKDFIGRSALLTQQSSGIKQKLIGFEMIDSGIARHGYGVQKNGTSIGRVTSGTVSPSLRKNIGLAYVSVDQAKIDNPIEIVIRQNLSKAKIVQIPFYERNRGVSK